MLGGVVLLLHHLLFPVSGQISLVCSGVSSQAPGRVTFFFLSRSPPSASVGGVQVKDVSGLVYTQNFATCGEVKPGEGGLASTSTVAEIGTNIRTSCSSVLENGLPLIDATATDTNKITCYKRLPDMPSLDVLDGGFFHVLAHGETDETAILIPAQLTDRIRTIWAVAIDGFGSGWLALSQALDGATEMAPCADVLTRTGNGNNAVTTREMWPCSVGLTGRWWYFQVGPAGGLAKCSSAPSGNVVRGDLSSSRVQSFCSDVPDGFLCPVACDASYVPTGSIRCQDGVWSNTFVCRSLQTACLSPITTAQVESANGRESWLIRGIQPDQQGDCGLFTRLGKKCGATCREGEFGQGQVHCVGGGGGNPNSLQVPSGGFKAETGFDCIPQVSDSMFPAPVITALTPVGDAIRVAATVTRDPNTVRSPIQQLTIRSVSGAMSCSVDRTGMSLSRTQVNDVPDLPDISIRRLSIDSEGFFVPANLSGLAASASSRRLVVADTCGTDFNGVNECMPGQDSGSCSACGPDDVTSDGSCFKAPSGSCDTLAGDFYSCKFRGWGSDSQRCFAAPPANYCVKRVCTYQGGTKSCSAFVPATNAPFCIGDPSLPAIDHAVIMYTCCDHNLLSFTGFCGGPTTPCVVRASGRGVCPTPQTDEYLVGAENLAGTSWSLPKAVTCSSIPTPSEPAKYEIPSSCTALVSGASCEVSCGKGYAKEGSGGTFTCQNGLSESPSGELPNCVALPSGIHVVQAPLASTTTTTTTSLPTRCAVCSTIGDWQDSRYASCRAWGDPHITESWRSNAPQRFDHQGTGVYKWATSNHCGGDFELQTFQCQYRGGRNAVITAVAARLNGGDRVFVSERTVTHSGDPAVDPSDAIHVDKQGVNVNSDDQCVFFSVNTKNLNSNPGFLHNLKIKVLAEDAAAEGVCGADKDQLRNSYVDPNGGQMLFTSAEHSALCAQCTGSGSEIPRGCATGGGGAPATFSPDCEFLAPLNGLDQECTATDDARFGTFQDNGQNCVAYAVLNRKKSCDDFCEERGSVCVTAKSDRGQCVLWGNRATGNTLPCSRGRMYDAICVCKKPDIPVPGETALEVCQTNNLDLATAESTCRAGNPALATAVFPMRSLETDAVVTPEEDGLDRMLQDCMTDVCSASTADRAVLAENTATENVGLPMRSCAFTDGRQIEAGPSAYPCNCGGVSCVAGQACTLGAGGSCATITSTSTVTSLTSTTTSTSVTTSTTATATSLTSTVTTITSTSTSVTATATSTTATATTVTSTRTTLTTSTNTATSTSFTFTGTSVTTTATTATSTTSTFSSTSSITITTSITSTTVTSTVTSTTGTSTTSATSTTSTFTVTSTSKTTTVTSTTITSTTSMSSTTSQTSSTTATTSTTITVTSTSKTSTTSSLSSTTSMTSTSVTTTSVTSSTLTTSTATSVTTSTVTTQTTVTNTFTTATMTSTTETIVTTTSTSTFFPLLTCGPWNPTGGHVQVTWDGGEFPTLHNDGNGWEWRVHLQKLPGGSEFLVPHCSDIIKTTCDIYCLDPDSTYQVRVELARTIPDVVTHELFADEVIVPPARADPPQDLVVTQQTADSLAISWSPAPEQGTCSFRSWQVEIRDPSGSWEQDPPACNGLSSFGVTSCTIANLACQTGYIIQVRQQCQRDAATSDWSRPVSGSTLATVGPNCLQPAGQPTALTATESPSTSDELTLSWTAGAQQDSQFLNWHVELYRTTFVAGQPDPSQEQQQTVCPGMLDRSTTSCTASGLAQGEYSFAIQERSSMPSTSSALSARSVTIWVPRRPAQPPSNVALSAAAEGPDAGARISWANGDLQDCVFLRTKVEVYDGTAWTEPEGCRFVTSVSATSCVATGLQSNTAYVARASVICDECSNTPPGQRVPCDNADTADSRCEVPEAGGGTTCFKKLAAFRSGSALSSPDTTSGSGSESGTEPFTTAPRREAVPSSTAVAVPTTSGMRATFSWTPGVGSATNADVGSDCVFQSYQMQIKKSDGNDWGAPEGCLSLTDPNAASCTATNLQCDTSYDARLRTSCLPASASSDWAAFPSFRTTAAGACAQPASAPTLFRSNGRTPQSLDIAFTAGSSGDCEFSRFELQMQVQGTTSWEAPSGCSLLVRSGPSCQVQNLVEDTAYHFRARELCGNGAPLASPWASTEEPFRTSFVPPVQQPSFVDPTSLVSGTTVPSRLMLFFESNLEFGDSSVPLSICPTLGVDTGPCQCVSVADCASRCLRRDDISVSLMSSRVLFVEFGAVMRPLTQCPYDVIVEEGFLQTQLRPAKLSPRVTWNFTYSPPVPLGEVSLQQSDTTSLLVHVTWDTPMTTICGVASGADLLQQTAPADFTGSRGFLEVLITGLVPSTQYTVICRGSAIGDPILTAEVTREGFSTARDTNDRLSSITLNIEAVCSEGPAVSVDAVLTPPFNPATRTYLATLNAEDMRSWCGPDETEAILSVHMGANAQSSFASVSLPQAQILAQPLLDASGNLPPGAGRSTSAQVDITVQPPQTGSVPAVPYRVDLILGVLDIRLENFTLDWNSTIDESSAGPSGRFVLSVPGDLDASYISILVGPYVQTLVLVSQEQYTENSMLRTIYIFIVVSVAGLGNQLPLIIQVRPPANSIHPSLDVRTGESVSFEPPTVSGVETDQGNGLVSATGYTFVTVSGSNLALPPAAAAGVGEAAANAEIYVVGIPASCSTEECQAQEIQSLVESGAPNLCLATVQVSADSLGCLVAPSASGRLGVCLLEPQGFFALPACSTFAAPGTVVPEQAQPGGLEEPNQDMSSNTPIVLDLDGNVPWENVSQGYLQVWVSPFGERPANLTNLPSGWVPMCSDAVIEDGRLVCYRNQNLNVSETGSTPNVYVQTGPDAMSDSLPQGLQVVSPRILSISRNHEYEVGELVITIEGEHFGTKDNGNMIVALETFGGQTQSVLDLRQAEGLGDPTIVISCETISHEDTRILSRCIQGGTSIFGDPVSESFYAERVEEPLDPGADATTRRLQQVSIDTLALQLSRLPVAISVNYELDCSILNRLNETCGLRPENISVPSSRQWQAVRLKPCPAGEHRINYTGTECLQCAPGKFKSGVGPALQCDVCPVAFYMGLFGAGACMACPDFETTQSTGALDIAACDCSPGYYRLSNGSDWHVPSNHGVCLPCPHGAICEGGAVMPYSASGYWTPDRIKFWHCFPDSACLQGGVQEPNLCAAGRTVDAIRCGQCAAHAWADAGHCYECHWWDDVISYVGPFLWPILMLGAFLTLVIRSLHTSDMSRTKKEKRLLRHKHSSWIGRLGELDHGEFRMLIICVTSLQTLWLVSLMPLPFTRFSELWLWGLGFSAWDFSIFRPQCGFKMSYLTKWLTQWSVFFIMMFLLVLSIWLYCHFHKNSRRDLNWIHPKQGILGMISLSLMILLLVHLRDDLIFTQCIHCEDDRFCLAAQPVIYCELSDWEWATMAVLSSLDIAFVIIGSIPLIGACIYKSWRWQHGEESALGSDFEAPWYVFFSEFWVKRHLGYIKEVRQAVPEFEHAYKSKHLEDEAMSKEVWQKAIDLILAQEAEKAEILLRRVIRHLYSHESRFDVVDMDEGASFKLTKQLRRADTKKEEDERFAAMSDSRHKDDGELRVSDVLHIKLTLDNLLDYAKAARGGVLQQMEEEAKTSRFTFFGTRVVKRMLCYSWALMLLLCRFSITVCAMVMPRDEGTLVPLAYMILKLSYILMMATLQPYVWSYLNDWEIVVHSLIFMFMMFVISDWSAMASDVLLVVATWAAIVPVLLRIFVICTIKEAPHDPDEIHVKQDVSYHLEQLHGGPAQHQMGLSFGSMAVSRAMQHVKKSIDVVERRQVTVVEKTYDERGYPVERTIVTQEEDMEHAEYTLDVQKDEVAFMLHGEEGDEPRPPGLEPLGEEDRQESDVYDIKL